MLRRTFAVWVLIVAGAWCLGSREAAAQACYPNFSYGSYAGYNFQQAAVCGPAVSVCGPRFGGWCGPRWGGWCAPRASWGWGWGCRPWGWRARWCAPVYPSYGWPACGIGYGVPAWYGTTWFSSYDSIYLNAPAGGTFFSGGLVPFPTIGYPVIAPGFAATSAAPRARAMVQPAMTAVASRPRGAVRLSNAAARLRAARLVAIGDQHLRGANGDPAAVRRAADAYRRASAIAGDEPDTFIRMALAHVALGDDRQADAAVARAVAVDGRLAQAPVARAGLPADPVFGDRPAGSPGPLAARGAALVRQIGARAAEVNGEPSVAWLADRWATRFGGDARALAANAPRGQ